MRFFKKGKLKTVGRRLAALAVVCGFALSLIPAVNVAGAQIDGGKVKIYKYTRLHTVSELIDYVGTNEWKNILLAWEDDDGKVYYSHKYTGTDEHNINYGIGSSAWFEITSDKNGYLGKNGFGVPDSDAFYSYEKIDSYINVKYTGKRNSNNTIKDTGEKAPIFQFQLEGNDGKKPYIQAYKINEKIQEYGVAGSADTSKWYMVHEKYKGENCFRMVVDIPNAQDWQMTHNDNEIDSSHAGVISDYEKYFRFYTCEEIEVDAYLQDIVVKSGESLRIKDKFLLPEDVKITVEDGGFLIIEQEFFNNGKIVLQAGGTMIMNKGSTVRSLCAKDSNAGSIRVNGGNLLVLEDARLIIDSESGELKVQNGGSVVNRGMIIVTELDIDVYGIVHNDEMGKIYLQKYLDAPDVGTDSMTDEELAERLKDRKSTIKDELDTYYDSIPFDLWISDYGQLVNYGEIHAPFGKNKFVVAARGRNTVVENRGSGTLNGSFVESCVYKNGSSKELCLYYCNGYPDERTIWEYKEFNQKNGGFRISSADKYGVKVINPPN